MRKQTHGFTLLEVALAGVVILVGMVAVLNIFRTPAQLTPQLDAIYRQRLITDQLLHNEAERLKEGHADMPFRLGVENSLTQTGFAPYSDNYWVYVRADKEAHQSASNSMQIQDFTLMVGNPSRPVGFYGQTNAGGGGGNNNPLINPVNNVVTEWLDQLSGSSGTTYTPRNLNSTALNPYPIPPPAPAPHPVSDSHAVVMQGVRDTAGTEDRISFSMGCPDDPNAVKPVGCAGKTTLLNTFTFAAEFMFVSEGYNLTGNQFRVHFRNDLDIEEKLTGDDFRGTVRIDGPGAMDAFGIQRYNITLGLVDSFPYSVLASKVIPNGLREHVWYKLEAQVNLVGNQNDMKITLYEEGGGGNPTGATPLSFSPVDSVSALGAANKRTNIAQYNGIGVSIQSNNPATLGGLAKLVQLGSVAQLPQLPTSLQPDLSHLVEQVTHWPGKGLGTLSSFISLNTSLNFLGFGVGSGTTLDEPFMLAGGGPGPLDLAPVTPPDALPIAYINDTYVPVVIQGLDGTPPYVSYTIDDGPGGLAPRAILTNPADCSVPPAVNVNAPITGAPLPAGFKLTPFQDPGGSCNWKLRLELTGPVVAAPEANYPFHITVRDSAAMGGGSKTRKYDLQVTELFLNPVGEAPPFYLDLPSAVEGEFWPPYVIEANGGVLDYDWKIDGTTLTAPGQSTTTGMPPGFIAETFSSGGETKLRIRLNTADNRVPLGSSGGGNDYQFDLVAVDNNGKTTDNSRKRFRIKVSLVRIDEPPNNHTMYIAAAAGVPTAQDLDGDGLFERNELATNDQPGWFYNFRSLYTGSSYEANNTLIWSCESTISNPPPGGEKNCPSWLGLREVPSAPLDYGKAMTMQLYNKDPIGPNCDGHGCPYFYNFRIRVKDASNVQHELEYRIYLTHVVVNPISLPNGIRGYHYPVIVDPTEPFPTEFTASGGTGPYTWIVWSENAPDFNLTFSEFPNPGNTGRLTTVKTVGAPTVATCTDPFPPNALLPCPRKYSVYVQVIDSVGTPSEPQPFDFNIVGHDGIYVDNISLSAPGGLGFGGGGDKSTGTYITGLTGRISISRLTNTSGFEKPGL